MRLPRDVSGDELVRLLRRYGYQATRQTGSHVRLTSTYRGDEHHLTIPRHKNLRVGTLNSILKDIADYLAISKEELTRELFGD
ncbi:MAG: type II toxin-antitoxin system HicA family toxin [Armatimonadetes bacterium]|nr:type II toxin-antitoxin system HicA family toxin [Armatimonadota bacterium]